MPYLTMHKADQKGVYPVIIRKTEKGKRGFMVLTSHRSESDFYPKLKDAKKHKRLVEYYKKQGQKKVKRVKKSKPKSKRNDPFNIGW